MTLSGDQSKNKMLPFLHHVLLIWMLLGVVSFVNCKPIVTSTPESVTVTKQHVVDIALPVSLSSTEDLIAWATYAVQLMASKINVTVSPKTNDTNFSTGTGSVSLPLLPKMEAMVKRLKTYMINSKPLPTKPTIYHKDNRSSVNAENKVDTSDSAAASSVLTRSIELYPKVPVGSVILDPQLSPYIRYAPGLLSPVYEQSGSRVYPQHAIFPGIGFLPLNNKENPFANRPTSTSSPREPRTDPTTATESATVVEAEIIQGLNEALIAETDVTTTSPLITVPFEAYITITREQVENVPPVQQFESTTGISQTVRPERVIVDSYSTINNQKPDDYFTTTSRDPPDEFPPFFNKSERLTDKNTNVRVIFEDEESTTPKSEKKKKVTKKNKSKSKKKKKKNGIVEMIMKMIPKKKNSTMNSNNVAPIIRIITERNEKLKKQKSSKKKPRIQNVNLEGEVDDYDDEKLGENDSDENDDSLNETGSKGSQEEDDDDDDDDDDEEEEDPPGSLQPILDLLPLIVPVLEDLSNPNTTTDLVGILTAAVPLIQGLIEGDDDTPGLNIGGTIGPILASLSEGPDGEGSDIGAVLGPILTLIAPLIGPIIGPIIGPTLRLSSNPPDKGFSLGALINSVAGPLSQPTDPWGLSPFASLVTQIVSGLSEELENELLGLDVGGLFNSVVMGLIAGTSAGLSGGSSGTHGGAAPPPAYGPAPSPYNQIGSATNYGNTYGNKVVPANTVNPLQLIGMSLQDILNAGVSVISSLITTVTGLSGASSAHDPPQSYGQPPPYAAQSQNNHRPRKSASAT